MRCTVNVSSPHMFARSFHVWDEIAGMRGLEGLDVHCLYLPPPPLFKAPVQI